MKKADGCNMREPLLAVFADFYSSKLGKDAISLPRKTKLCNVLLTTPLKDMKLKSLISYKYLNNYHPNITVTCKINQEKFPCTKVCCFNS